MSDYPYNPPESNIAIEPRNTRAHGPFRLLLILLLIGNGIFALAYGVGLLSTISSSDADKLAAFDLIRPLLYAVDIPAAYLLLKLNKRGLYVILVSSILYMCLALQMELTTFGGLAFKQLPTSPAFLLSPVVIPFLDVALIYLFGGKQLDNAFEGNQGPQE